MGGAAAAALLLAAVLAPGLAYRVGRERRLPERHRRGAADNASLLVAGATSTALALWGFAAVRGVVPGHTPDIGQMISAPGDYISGHLPYVAGWATAVYAAAFAVAAAEGRFGLVARLLAFLRLGGLFRGIRHESAWWVAFKADRTNGSGREKPLEASTYVWCALTDGSYLGDQIRSFSSDAVEGPDRDLLLQRPIHYLPAAKADLPSPPLIELPKVDSAVVSAARIQYLTASHLQFESSQNR